MATFFSERAIVQDDVRASSVLCGACMCGLSKNVLSIHSKVIQRAYSARERLYRCVHARVSVYVSV